ncbi:MAG: thiamine diphosphokinase [Pseudomonadota bacterium]
MRNPSIAAPPLRFDAPVALLGGAGVDPEGYALAAARTVCDVAADGGANALTPGAAPRLRAVIGDMDSVSDLDAWRADPSVSVHAIDEQDSTDLEKCLYTVAAPLYLGLGFLGARFDHTLAATHVLLRYADRRVVLIGEEDVLFMAPLHWRARLSPGARVSVFPLRPVRALASSGLAWPLEGLAFETGLRVGTSNRAAADLVEARFEAPGAAIILGREWLDAAIDSLTSGE